MVMRILERMMMVIVSPHHAAFTVTLSPTKRVLLFQEMVAATSNGGDPAHYCSQFTNFKYYPDIIPVKLVKAVKITPGGPGEDQLSGTEELVGCCLQYSISVFCTW